jgi:hypothetical protein
MSIDYKSLMKGNENRKAIKFPFSDETVYFRLLTEYDEVEASRATDKEYINRGEINFQNAVERSSFKVAYELHLALITDEGDKIYPDVETFLKYTNKEVIRRLYEEYNTFEKSVYPSVTDISDEQMSEILAEVKKNSKIVLTFTDSNFLKKLILFMVYQESLQQSGN